MKRRGFFGALAGLVASPAAAVLVTKQEVPQGPELPPDAGPLRREMVENFSAYECVTAVWFEKSPAVWKDD